VQMQFDTELHIYYWFAPMLTYVCLTRCEYRPRPHDWRERVSGSAPRGVAESRATSVEIPPLDDTGDSGSEHRADDVSAKSEGLSWQYREAADIAGRA